MKRIEKRNIIADFDPKKDEEITHKKFKLLQSYLIDELIKNPTRYFYSKGDESIYNQLEMTSKLKSLIESLKTFHQDELPKKEGIEIADPEIDMKGKYTLKALLTFTSRAEERKKKKLKDLLEESYFKTTKAILDKLANYFFRKSPNQQLIREYRENFEGLF